LVTDQGSMDDPRQQEKGNHGDRSNDFPANDWDK